MLGGKNVDLLLAHQCTSLHIFSTIYSLNMIPLLLHMHGLLMECFFFSLSAQL